MSALLRITDSSRTSRHVRNVHTSGLLHRNKTRTQPITLSVRASTIGSVEPCYSIRIARRFIRLTL
jgi:hypothetical protein